MANIPLPKTTYSVLPEGEHIFRIYRVEYKEKFGKLNIYMVTADGYTHIERFSFLKNDGSSNDIAYMTFAYFAKTAMNNFEIESVDPFALLNHYIKAEIAHNILPKRDNPNETVTFTKIVNKWVADGFDKEPCEKALRLGMENSVPPKTEPKQETPQNFNLDDMLN